MKPAEVRDSAAVPSSVTAGFELLFAANYDDLLRYCARRVGPDAAPDVVADVFLVAWRRRREYSQHDGRLWLFGVARKLAANEQRGQQRRIRLSERIHTERIHTERIDTERIGADRTVSDDGFDALDDALRVRQMLATLPPLEQEALRLTEWDQFDIGEAAVIAGCSRATFRVRLHRARRRLARRLSEELHQMTRENP